MNVAIYKKLLNKMQQQDSVWMQQAIQLAMGGLGQCSPNPAVGAVIVHEGRCIGSGWHEFCGQAHAEINALRAVEQAGLQHLLPQSCLYVTLEPCSSHGRTGACCNAIIASGIKRVVYACRDPYELHAGVAKHIMQQAGIEVLEGVCAEQASFLIAGFVSRIQRKRPWVIAKAAMSLDGSMTRPQGESSWLSGPESKSYVHQLRSRVDAVMVGYNTLLADDPELTVRLQQLPQGHPQPWRVVASRTQGVLPAACKLASDEFAERSLLLDGKRLELELQRLCSDYAVNFLLVEGGAQLLDSMLELGLIDEWVGIICPRVVGQGVKLRAGLSASLRLENPQYLQLGQDMLVRGKVLQA